MEDWMAVNIRIGTDIVHIPRIQAALDRFGERFLQRVYTPMEQQDCGLRCSPISIVSLAGRWAAKEAVVKAIGTGWKGVGYTDVEVQRQSDGSPTIQLYRSAAIAAAHWGQCQWQISLSHDGDYAIATALMTCWPSPSALGVIP